LAELTAELLAEALELIDRKAAELRPEDWEWTVIGDNNLLAAETASALALLLPAESWGRCGGWRGRRSTGAGRHATGRGAGAAVAGGGGGAGAL
jgi:hypothetical protein